MDETQGETIDALPPFLTKIYDMVDDPSTNWIISWSLSNRSFVVWNQAQFTHELLPKCFRHSNFSSFIRQLNAYGFRKTDPARWEFANDDFIKGRRDLLRNIQNRKLIHNQSVQVIQELRRSASQALSQSEKQKLENKIGQLKHERSLLYVELETQTKECQRMKFRMQSLEDRLFEMENRQHQMVSFFAHFMQRPSYDSDVKHKRRRLSTTDSFQDSHVNPQSMSQIGIPLHQTGLSELDAQAEPPKYSPSLYSFELDQSIKHVEIPIASSIKINAEFGEQPEVSPDVVEAWKQDVRDGTGVNAIQNGVKDEFWEQVLIENLGSCDELQQLLTGNPTSSDIHEFP